MDVIDDLWTIFECPECGVLFFSEEKTYSHCKDVHGVGYKPIFSMEFIRAIPQKKE